MGGPSKIFWSFMSPNNQCFIAFLLTNFRNFPKVSEIYSTFSISTKTIFVAKFVKNHCIDLNLAKFSLQTPKNSKFFLETLKFLKFSAPSGPKIWSELKRSSLGSFDFKYRAWTRARSKFLGSPGSVLDTAWTQ